MRLPARAVPLIAALLATPALAVTDFRAVNGIWVDIVSLTEFSTQSLAFAGNPDHWCAAGDYVIRRLNVSSSTRIYRLPPARLHSGLGVNFSLSSKGAVPTGITTFGAKDIGMSASEARALCDFVPNFPFR